MMEYRRWSSTPDDFAALARLTNLRYPDTPTSVADITRSFEQVHADRPFFTCFCVLDGQEVGFSESFPTDRDGDFLLEVFILKDFQNEEILRYLIADAEKWAASNGASNMLHNTDSTDDNLDIFSSMSYSIISKHYTWQINLSPTELTPSPFSIKPLNEVAGYELRILEIVNASRKDMHLNPYSEEDLKANFFNWGLFRPDLIFVAMDETRFIGLLSMHAWESSLALEAGLFYVDPSFRGQGLGSQLLKFAVVEGFKNGYSSIYISHSENVILHSLLTKNGYNIVSMNYSLNKKL